MRLVLGALLVLVLLLQYRLWLSDEGYAGVRRLAATAAVQREENAVLAERNRALAAEVQDLKGGLEAVEEIARSELGMIREGETLYLVAEPEFGGAPEEEP
jgi:cell division protein FtsB